MRRADGISPREPSRLPSCVYTPSASGSHKRCCPSACFIEPSCGNITPAVLPSNGTQRDTAIHVETCMVHCGGKVKKNHILFHKLEPPCSLLREVPHMESPGSLRLCPVVRFNTCAYTRTQSRRSAILSTTRYLTVANGGIPQISLPPILQKPYWVSRAILRVERPRAANSLHTTK